MLGEGRAAAEPPPVFKEAPVQQGGDTPALFLSGNKETPQARAQWVVVPAGSFPPPPPSLCFLGTLSCAPKATSKPTQKTCLISLPPSLPSFFINARPECEHSGYHGKQDKALFSWALTI